MDQEEIGRRMKAAAEAAGFDPYRMAQELGVRPPTVYRWYKGQSRPSNEVMSQFAAVVGRSTGWLWTGAEEVEDLLLRWARFASEQMPASEAVRSIRGDYGSLTQEHRALLDQSAPGMLQMLNELAGGDWARLDEEGQRQALRALVDRLEEWRQRQQ